MGEDALRTERSSVAGLHESQDLVVPSPSPVRSSPAQSLSRAAGGAAASSRAGEGQGQVHAITVLTLLDKLVNMLDTVQENQLKIERRQAGLELAVRGVQNDVIKLSKNHTSTSNTVSKLLEKSRKVSLHSREVRDRMDRQAEQVKRLEASHAHLLKRNNFKVLIFQEEKEIPASVFVKNPAPLPCEALDEVPADTNRSQEEALQTIELSSDEEPEPDREEEEAELADEHLEKSRAEKIKRSSLKKVDSLKKAFSRQNIEKKMNKIGSKIVSPEKREKIKKSLSHSGKSPSLKLPPLTFGIGKKGKGGESTSQEEGTPAVDASIELAPINGLGEEEEEHSEPVECKAEADSMEKEEEVPSPSASGVDDEPSVKEDEIPEGTLSTPLSQEDPALPSTPQPQKQEEEVEPEKGEKEELIQENESYIEEEVEKDVKEERESVTEVEKEDEDKENPKEEMAQAEQENDGGQNAPEKESHVEVEEMEHSQENSQEEKETHEEADQEGGEENEEEKLGKVEVEEKKDGDLNVQGEEETPVVVEKEAVEEQNPHEERMSPVEALAQPESLMVQQAS